jgi:hypothetical protein
MEIIFKRKCKILLGKKIIHKFPQKKLPKKKASWDMGPRAGLPFKPFSHGNL